VSEVGDSQSDREALIMEFEEFTVLETVTRQRLLKTQQTETSEYVLD
jgi:hypothetical protein